jgi:drug/metabolite transporter (DMT)-like permease
MLAAGLGWGIYSLAGRKARDPLVATAANFLLAAPLGLLLSLALPGTGAPTVEPSTTGLALAVTSGVLTSGLGYALWYHVLPQITGSAAAVAQLTVPVLAMAGGMLALAEPLTAQFALAAVVVLGGVALSLVARK